jgi:hypothetical protein
MSNYNILIHKLDGFTRKYYKNELLKGAIYSAAILLVFYLFIITLDHFGKFDILARTILFYCFLLVNSFVLFKLMLIPLFKLYKLGKVISYEQAAEMIGLHFNEVKDKLLNTLQLHHQLPLDQQSVVLLQAGIDQKIMELKPVPFSAAINFKENKKYLKFFFVPLFIALILVIGFPRIFTESTKRLIHHRTYFEAVAPFQFQILNPTLVVEQYSDFELNLKLLGDEIPDQVYIELGGNQYKLKKENIVSFNYLFKNVQGNEKFRLAGGGHKSAQYELKALPKPVILNFDIALEYPKYIRKKDETVKNTGDLLVPMGTKITWNFFTRNTDVLHLSIEDSIIQLNPSEENKYQFSKMILQNISYYITTSNEFLKSRDSIAYGITVIPDQYPSIKTEEARDSLSDKRKYYRGMITDDYGFSKLSFNYQYLKSDSSQNNVLVISKNIPFNKANLYEVFFYTFDLASLLVNPGESIEYYFEVWDNDGVNGPKSSRSEKQIYKAPSLEELAHNTEIKNENIKDDLQESIKEAKKIQHEIDALNKKLMDDNKLSWDEKKKLKDLLARQNELIQKIEDIKNENSQNLSQQQEYKQIDEEILRKQEELQKLFDELLTDEMKEMYKELEEMLDQMDKDKTQEMLDKMNLSNEDISKELDRSLEVFKQLEFQQKLQESIEKLEELSKEQQKLSEESKEGEKSNDELQQLQEDLNKKFEAFSKDMQDVEKKNQELEYKQDMEDTKTDQQNIQNDMKQSSEQLKDNKEKKASESQKNAADKMDQLAQKLNQMQEAMQQQQMQEDMQALRQILENLLKVSFDQEKLMADLKSVNRNDPQYVKLTQDQKQMKDDIKIIEDSLLALSKRVMQIQSAINKELNALDDNMGKTISFMAERNISQANSRQQYSMTSINNLALLLSEVLNSMQQQMASSMAGSGQCNKPGGKGMSVQSLKEMQQQLSQQLEQMKNGGQRPKGEGQSKDQGGGEGGHSEQLAKMAAKQAAIRQAIQKMSEQMGNNGSGQSKNLEKMQQLMDQTETDIVNKRITQETINRQKEILTRLLEAENAQRQQEQDNKRQSQENKKELISNPKDYFEYTRQKMNETELLKTIPPALNPFYRERVNKYFNTFVN